MLWVAGKGKDINKEALALGIVSSRKAMELIQRSAIFLGKDENGADTFFCQGKYHLTSE